MNDDEKALRERVEKLARCVDEVAGVLQVQSYVVNELLNRLSPERRAEILKAVVARHESAKQAAQAGEHAQAAIEKAMRDLKPPPDGMN